MISKQDILYITKETEKVQILFNNGDFKKVIQKTKNLLKKDPSQPLFYNMLGLSYRQLDNLDLAEKIFKLGLEVKPNSTSILINLGAMYRVQERFDEAKKTLGQALEINQNNFSGLVNYANVLRDLNQDKRAINYYNKALSINSKNETLLINLAGSYQMIGEFELSKKVLRDLQNKFPHNTVADQMFSSINNYAEDKIHQQEMLKKLNNENISNNDKMILCFSIAKSFSDQKNPEMSSKYFVIANDLKFNLIENYDFEEQTKDLTNQKNDFREFDFDSEIPLEKPELIFIVGLPRSGTTLTHQIISSHSKVYGAGESSLLKNFFTKKLEEHDFIKKMITPNNYQNDYKNNIKNQLLKMFMQYDKNQIILDKAPLNFIWIGFIRILFPTAKIIHCKRNLKDTALSIYKNMYEGWAFPWSYNQQHLIKFINLYKELMSFWHSKMPDYIYDCHYENLVNDPIEETKKLINFCNLEMEPGCLDHTKNKTAIKTVSIEQARKPIYKNSVNLNKNYSKYLDFLNQISE